MTHQAGTDDQCSLRVVTRTQARAIDSEATDLFGIPSIVLMENASRALAAVTLRMLETNTQPNRSVHIICGAGNNGGDGYAAGRHLHNAGCNVTIVRLSTPRPGSDAATNANICRRMDLPIVDVSALGRIVSTSSIIIDAIFGTGLDRDVTGDAAHVIAALNECTCPIVAADVPSGLDCETGLVLGEAVWAATTVTFAALKPGFFVDAAQPYLGRVVVAGIGAPVELLEAHSKPADPEMCALMQIAPTHFDSYS